MFVVSKNINYFGISADNFCLILQKKPLHAHQEIKRFGNDAIFVMSDLGVNHFLNHLRIVMYHWCFSKIKTSISCPSPAITVAVVSYQNPTVFTVLFCPLALFQTGPCTHVCVCVVVQIIPFWCVCLLFSGNCPPKKIQTCLLSLLTGYLFDKYGLNYKHCRLPSLLWHLQIHKVCSPQPLV